MSGQKRCYRVLSLSMSKEMQLTLNIRLDWLKKWAKNLIFCVGLCPYYGLISNLHMIPEYSKPVVIDIECTHINCQTHTTQTQKQNEEFDTIPLIFKLEWLPLWCLWTCIFDQGSGLVWFSTTCLNKVLVRIIISVFYSCTNWKLNVEMHRSHKGLHDVFLRQALVQVVLDTLLVSKNTCSDVQLLTFCVWGCQTTWECCRSNWIIS